MVVPLDKQLHFLLGVAVTSSVTLYSTPTLGLLACAVVAIGKELYDMTGRGTPELWDIVATLLGGSVVIPHYL